MTAAPRTGRPLQALAVLGALIVGWLAGRWPLLKQDVQVAVTKAERSQMLADEAARSALRLAIMRPLSKPTMRLATVDSPPAVAARPVRAAVGQQVAASGTAERLAYAAIPTHIRPSAARAQAVSGIHPFRHDRSIANSRIPDTHTAKTAALPISSPALTTTATVMRPPAPAVARPPTAFDFATRAYAAQASGSRRLAAHDFDAAIAVGSADPRAPAWAAARRALGKRWSGSAYVFARPRGSAGFGLDPGTSPGGTPLLGSSQSGAALAFRLDPLARRPLDLTARVTGSVGTDQHQAEAAVGVRWHVRTVLSFSAERLIALGPGGRHDWTLRLAGGHAIQIGPVTVDGYGEAGIVGIKHPAQFAAGQARAGYPLALTPAFTFTPGIGIWAGGQRDRLATTNRVDAGPSLRLHWARRALPVDIAVDYRRRVAGNAAPGSGAAVTLSTGF